MIEPGEVFQIEHEDESFESVCLTRTQQRKVLSELSSLSTIEESVESIGKVYDIADELLTICFPCMEESTRDRMSNADIFAIVGKVIAAHSLTKEAKKKLESRHSLEAAISAAPA